MKREWMQSIRDILCIVLNHLLLVAAVITVSDLFQAASPNILGWMALVIIPLGLYYITKKTPKLIPPWMAIFFLGVMSMIEKIMTVQDWGIYYYVITFAYVMGYFVYYFTNKFLDFLRLNQNTASNIPIADIFRNGIGLTVLFSACSSVILFLSANLEWVKAIADRIWGGIVMMLRFVFAGIETSPLPAQKEEMTPPDPQLGGANLEGYIAKDTLDDFRNAVIILLCIAIVIGFILFLYYVYWVIKSLEKSQIEKKQKGKLLENEDVREYCGIEKNTQRKGAAFVFLNNREKVRKLYQKKILKRKKDLVGEQEQQLKYLTAKECCDRLSEQQLKLVYEKARYSEESITAEDIRLAK